MTNLESIKEIQQLLWVAHYGTITYKGKKYTLTQQPYIMGVGIEEWRSE